MERQKLVVADADVVSRCRAVTIPGSYAVLPRANRVLGSLPVLDGAQAQVLAAPPHSRTYVAHELILSPGGGSSRPVLGDLEQFLYVLEGGIELHFDGQVHHLAIGGYCWLPPGRPFEFRNPDGAPSRALWLRRRYMPAKDTDIPGAIIRQEKDIPAFPEDTYMEQHLIPYEDLGFDMGCNLLSFQAGTYFSFVESHIMEHGLYMLQGRGIYWLNGDYVEVQKDDFMYMAPYCPQFFFATGWEESRYLVYKDVNRDYEGLL